MNATKTNPTVSIEWREDNGHRRRRSTTVDQLRADLAAANWLDSAAYCFTACLPDGEILLNGEGRIYFPDLSLGGASQERYYGPCTPVDFLAFLDRAHAGETLQEIWDSLEA